jgi:predicted aspartyl protease
MQPIPSVKPNAFTVKANGGLLGIVMSDITVQAPDSLSSLTIKAVWDTGADKTTITKGVATKLLLYSTGTMQIYTANGLAMRQTYRINLGLPNNVLIRNLIVYDVEALSNDCDALIGMDIITLGDFSITNYKENTCMSFRVPSCYEIDYVKNPTYGITAI